MPSHCKRPSPGFGAWAKQLRRCVTAVASAGDTVSDLTGLGIEPKTPRTDSDTNQKLHLPSTRDNWGKRF